MAWWAIPAVMAAIGGAAGSMKDRSEQGIDVGGPGGLENQATGITSDMLKQLQQQVGLGPGAADVSAGYAASQGLAKQLEQYSKGGFLPTEADWTTAGQFAQQAYQPQQVAIQQQFKQEQLRANQLAVQLGRPVNDPIIQSKLSQERMQAQERLGAAQGAYASQYAQNLPQQRLGYTAQLADVRNALASQAMSNRQALLSLGSQLTGQERQFRVATGRQFTESGGGMKGLLQGGVAGFGSGLGVGGMMGGGGAGASQAASGAGGFVGGGSTYGGGMGMLGANTSFAQAPMTAPSFRSTITPNYTGPTSGMPSFMQNVAPPSLLSNQNYAEPIPWNFGSGGISMYGRPEL